MASGIMIRENFFESLIFSRCWRVCMPHEHSAIAAGVRNSLEVLGMSSALIATKSKSMILVHAGNS